MPSPEQVARAHQADRQAVTKAAADAAAQAWGQVEPAQVVPSWMVQVPQLTVVVGGAQLASAQTADDYLDESADAAGLDPTSDLEVDPQTLAGVASDGRGLGSLLMSPAFAVLQALAAGASSASAVQLGGQHLDTIARTQVADAGRLADGVALTARKEITGYVRQIVGATCSRCIILAGRFYRWNAGFQRHPRCDCVHLGATREQWREPGRFHDTRELYDAMTRAERQRAGWSLADQRAIDEGADIFDVTNVRGVNAAGVSRQAGRLLPSDIYRLAGADRDEAIRLLRANGYLRGRVLTTTRRADLGLAAQVPAVDLSKLTVVQLRQRVRELGLKGLSRARKAELVEALSKAGATTATAGLERMTVVQLRAEARARGMKIPAGSRKADIVALLEGRTTSAKAALKAPPRKAAAPKTFKRTDLTRADLARLEGERDLPVLRRRLAEATHPATRKNIQRAIDEAQNKIDQLPSLHFNWASPYWSEVGGYRISGTVSKKMLADHIEAIVGNLPPRLRAQVVDELLRQAEMAPRSVLELLRVPEFAAYDTSMATSWAYQSGNTRGIYFNPAIWGQSEAELDRLRRQSLLGGWWSRSDALDAASGTFAHEFGHHLARRVFNADLADLDRIARVFDDGLGAGGFITDEVRRGGNLESAIDQWLTEVTLRALGGTLRHPVSAYAMESAHETLAEIWHEYTTSRHPRPHIKAMGDMMRELAEKWDIIRL